MRILVAVIAVAAACVEPSLVPCGDKLCPEDSVCLAGDRCATTTAIEM